MKIERNGEQVDVDQVFPVSENEPWNEYQLENGIRIRMKTVAQQIFKVRGTENEYVVRSSNILSVDAVSDD